jgi:magnesium chelatase family protein
MTNVGLECEKVEIEVDLFPGLPNFTIVGLGDTAVQESRERVRSAIKNSGFFFPVKKITANLAPADVRKSGPSFDLPIAIGILLATGQLQNSAVFEKSIFVGELALNGELRNTHGVLPIVAAAVEAGFEKIFLPKINAPEAALLDGIQIFGAENLREVFEHLAGEKEIPIFENFDFEKIAREENFSRDFESIRGQEHAKRALEIAAAGSHNILMNGAPGAGKTLMARAFSSILPRMTREESLEVTKLFSIAKLLPNSKPLMVDRQVRVVHHTASAVSIVGGGTNLKPGEISLAHRGVLFLDEFSEFPSQVLEVLRQPLEDREITISRAKGSVTFPAHFTLVAAMNPCPCGFHGVPDCDRECSCTAAQIARYRKKISGPLLDRIDLFVEISPVKFEKLTGEKTGENSQKIRERVQRARDLQISRFKSEKISVNSEMNSDHIEKFCEISNESKNLLQQAVRQFSLSARGFHKILKIARTIADLENSKNVEL